MPRILLTGFEPFAGADDNPSARLVAAFSELPSSPVLELTSAVLPVSVERLPHLLHTLLDSVRPDVVLGLGEARGSAVIRVERVAVNLLDFRTSDNDGRVVRDSPIIPGGPPAYFTTLPAGELLAAIADAGVSCAPSLSAGAYLCNQMMYLALHWAAVQARGPRVGFLHVPSLPTQNTTAAGGCPSMDLATQFRAVSAVIAWVGGRGPK